MLQSNVLTNDLVCCPICGNELVLETNYYLCADKDCESRFPLVDKIPILINESKSIFEIKSFVNRKETTFISDKGKTAGLKKIINKLIPSINANFISQELLIQFSDIINSNSKKKTILIIGGSVSGIGMDNFLSLNKSHNIIISDVSLGGDVNMICDCHSLPLKNNSIDVVIIQAVLEHVLDPYLCVSELTRVLKEGGLVLSEVPFIQQLHQDPFDFTRFTHIGHRWLFRDYEHIDSGVVCGSGMGLAWSLRGFVKTLFTNILLQKISIKLVHILFFWIKYFDFRKHSELRGGFETASSIYFIGKLSSYTINFNELVDYYNERK